MQVLLVWCCKWTERAGTDTWKLH